MKLTDLGLLCVDLLLRDDTFVIESRVALEIDLDVVELRLIFCELAFGLFEHDLVGAGIDFDERIAFMNELALGKIYFDDLAIDSAADGDCIKGCDRPETDEIHGKIALLGCGDNDRYRPEHAEAAGASLSIGARSPLCAGLARRVRSAVVPDANGDDAENDNPEPPAAFGGLCRGRLTRALFGKLYGIKMAHPFSPVSKTQ